MAGRAGAPVVAGLALGAWCAFVFQTVYLEPLPWTPASLGIAIVLVAAVGAGLVAGWHGLTFVVLPAALAAVIAISVGAIDTSGQRAYVVPVDDEIEINRWLYEMALIPLMVGVGALASRRASRPLVVGSALLALPLVLVGWAMVRHARPVDHESSPHLIVAFVPSGSKKTPFVGSYRGVRVGDEVQRLLDLLGPPDRREVDDGIDVYWYGRDSFAIWGDKVREVTVKDERAGTMAGVGIGDNLALAKRHTADCEYKDSGDVFEPSCSWNYPFQTIRFAGDPIERVVVF